MKLEQVAAEHPGVVVVVLVAVAVAAYFVHSRIYPYTSCGWCKGSSGKSRASGFRRVWKDCPHCKGSGRRLRFGAWLLQRRAARKAAK